MDVLRASTTMITALEAGAREVIPCLEVEEARAAAAEFLPGEVLLGGERHGLRIDGFDLGNSPAEYTPDVVAGKTLIFTTTNGTRALGRCRLAKRVLVGAFVNATAVVQELLGADRIFLMCAGTEGKLSRDDLLLAGFLVDRLQRQGGAIYQLNVQAADARKEWLSAFPKPTTRRGLSQFSGTTRSMVNENGTVPFGSALEPTTLARQLRDSLGGRNLVEIGMESDILAAAQVDRFARVPELTPDHRRVRLNPSGAP
jgi:2-phosphosulfolactate phosphatase